MNKALTVLHVYGEYKNIKRIALFKKSIAQYSSKSTYKKHIPSLKTFFFFINEAMIRQQTASLIVKRVFVRIS